MDVSEGVCGNDLGRVRDRGVCAHWDWPASKMESEVNQGRHRAARDQPTQPTAARCCLLLGAGCASGFDMRSDLMGKDLTFYRNYSGGPLTGSKATPRAAPSAQSCQSRGEKGK